MAKKPKPKGPSDHPSQLRLFAPPLASTLREADAAAKLAGALYGILFAGYLTAAQTMPDNYPMKSGLFQQAIIVAIVLAIVVMFEWLRTNKVFDHAALGNAPRWGLMTLNDAAILYALYLLISLPALHSTYHQQRLQENQRIETDNRRKEEERKQDEVRRKEEDERLAACNTQRGKEIDDLVKVRKAAYAAHQKCLADWQKPSMFSKETAEEACAPKHRDYQIAAAAVKAREAKTCMPG